MKNICRDFISLFTGLIGDEQGKFRARRGSVDQIFKLKQIVRKHERKNVVYVGFIDFENAYDKVNREFLVQVLRMYDMGGKLLNGIKSIYVDSLACVRISENEWFRIDSGVRQWCIMSPWLFNVYMDGGMKEGSEIPGVGERMKITWPLVCS